MSEKLGQEPAFACECVSANGSNRHIQEGMSKRFYAACAAMQGLISNSNKELVDKPIKYLVTISYTLADELLKQENL